MIPPTSIDGTDITGATIDGTDVQEITVDGDVVFSATTLPVAYSNLVAWYPFDSATYGGSDADDVTGIIGGSGDDTGYDGTVSGASYQSSGGVTDIRAGANSGAFDFDGNDEIVLNNFGNLGSVIDTNFTLTMNVKTSDGSFNGLFGKGPTGNTSQMQANIGGFDGPNGSYQLFFRDDTATDVSVTAPATVDNTYHHVAFVRRGSSDTDMEIFEDGGTPLSTTSHRSSSVGNISDFTVNPEIGNVAGGTGGNYTIDDVRIYNTDLSQSQIQAIVDNTPA